MPFTAQRYHDISCGHRVVGHENKCRHLHGHNYRIHFRCRAVPLGERTMEDDIKFNTKGLDHIGRVIDFSDIKSKLCMWIENNWDHKFLAWIQDDVMQEASSLVANEGLIGAQGDGNDLFNGSIVWTPFNPTAENMAQYLVEVVGPEQLKGTGIELYEVLIEETAKCHASYIKGE